MKEELSLLKFCQHCKAKCCKTGDLIGSPILSKKEVSKLAKNYKNSFKEVTSPEGEKYYLIPEKKGTNNCSFLSDHYKCLVQDRKPLDCLCYPIKAVYDNGRIKFIIDDGCPAATHLDKNFIKKAKRIAIKSIRRFKKETYQHWLNNNVGWVKKAKTIDEFFG